MKKSFLSICLLYCVNIVSQAQEAPYGLNSPEHLLDGYEFNYQYQSGHAIHIEFESGKLTYQWIAGTNEGNPAKTLPYLSRKIDDQIYLINWHEKEHNNFITLVLNLRNQMVASSVIVDYDQEEPVIAFQGGVIEQLKGKGD